MSKYFIDKEIYFQGKKQPPRKIILYNVDESNDGTMIKAQDELGNYYNLELSEVFDDNDNPIKDARTRLGLSQEKFANLFEIPKRTLEDWETQKSKPPKYVENLIIEKVFSMIDEKTSK